jgi:hypothetical protein
MREKLSAAITGAGTGGQGPGRRGFIPVREPGTGWLLFLYDPERKLIEVQRRGQKTLVDLAQLDDGGLTSDP